MSNPQHVSLDDRSRNDDGTIREKRGDTRVATLRETYGENFAPGASGNMMLSTLLERMGMPSLHQYVHAGMPSVPTARR
jgi:hypothetical protein